MPWNIDALVEGFAEGCEVRFGSVQLSGQAALRAFFESLSYWFNGWGASIRTWEWRYQKSSEQFDPTRRFAEEFDHLAGYGT
jgi:hypothetical protein